MEKQSGAKEYLCLWSGSIDEDAYIMSLVNKKQVLYFQYLLFC